MAVMLTSPSPVGPGLAIRVICADEPYICKDFAETNNILKIITDFSAMVKKVREQSTTSLWQEHDGNNRVCLNSISIWTNLIGHTILEWGCRRNWPQLSVFIQQHADNLL